MFHLNSAEIWTFLFLKVLLGLSLKEKSPWYNFNMKWYEITEKSAGQKRLAFTLFLYKIFGKIALDFVAFVIGTFTFLGAGDIKSASFKYFSILYNYTKKDKFKPSLWKVYLNILNYAFSLADKIQIFSGKFKTQNIEFENQNIKEEFFGNLEEKQGAILIFNHIGNIEAMRSLVVSNNHKVIIFLQENTFTIFRKFIENLSLKPENLVIYPVEKIDMTTFFELDKELSKGAVVLFAGDRISSKSNKNINSSLLGAKVTLPYGVFRLAQKFNSPVYFVSCLKERGKYKIFLENAPKNDKIVLEWTSFMEKMILKQPFQFYHFYDFFEN